MLEINRSFDKLPHGYAHKLLEGTTPMYGRDVVSIEVVNPNKWIVTLGKPTLLEKAYCHVSKTSTIAVYGEMSELTGEDSASDFYKEMIDNA